jgi:hypothetical protein
VGVCVCVCMYEPIHMCMFGYQDGGPADRSDQVWGCVWVCVCVCVCVRVRVCFYICIYEHVLSALGLIHTYIHNRSLLETSCTKLVGRLCTDAVSSEHKRRCTGTMPPQLNCNLKDPQEEGVYIHVCVCVCVCGYV